MIKVAVADGVATLTLNRPEKLNALSTALEEELLHSLQSRVVKESRAVVLAGGPRAFSAGADTSELQKMTPAAIDGYYRGSGRLYEFVADMPQPTVAALSGYCLGAGLELALAADLRVGDETCVLGLPEVALGIVPSSGGLYRMVRAVGPARTRDVVLRGRRLDAQEANQWGLLTELVPAGQQLSRAIEIAYELGNQPARALSAAKLVISAATEASREAVLLLERLAYTGLNQPEP
jgi:enoyl-CoA hydratase/carnithine racemase